TDGFLDDEEFIVLYDYYQPVNPSFPYWNFDPFCLDVFDSCECEAHFRVAKDDIPIPLTNCFGFINCTVRPICRPGEKQRVVYNGHKRVHALKISIRSSAKWFDSKSLWSRGRPMSLWRPSLPSSSSFNGPLPNREVPVFTADMEAFNSAMSSARTSVEWLFGDISNSFKFLDFKKNLKLGLSAVGKQYI
ncbi:unnamed protein product, partial [Pocillopora meandrina]